MSHILTQLKVKDYNRWRSLFDQRREVRKAQGSEVEVVFQNSRQPDHVVVLFTWDHGKAREYIESPDLKAALEQVGARDLSVLYLERSN